MKLHPVITNMLKDADAFCKMHGMSVSRFGRLAMNDGNFLRAMRQGVRTPTIQTLDRVHTFMHDYSPPKEAYNEQTPIKAGDRADKRRPARGSSRRRAGNAPGAGGGAKRSRRTANRPQPRD